MPPGDLIENRLEDKKWRRWDRPSHRTIQEILGEQRLWKAKGSIGIRAILGLKLKADRLCVPPKGYRLRDTGLIIISHDKVTCCLVLVAR
jgi:hypothetical protein